MELFRNNEKICSWRGAKALNSWFKDAKNSERIEISIYDLLQSCYNIMKIEEIKIKVMDEEGFVFLNSEIFYEDINRIFLHLNEEPQNHSLYWRDQYLDRKNKTKICFWDSSIINNWIVNKLDICQNKKIKVRCFNKLLQVCSRIMDVEQKEKAAIVNEGFPHIEIDTVDNFYENIRLTIAVLEDEILRDDDKYYYEYSW